MPFRPKQMKGGAIFAHSVSLEAQQVLAVDLLGACTSQALPGSRSLRRSCFSQMLVSSCFLIFPLLAAAQDYFFLRHASGYCLDVWGAPGVRAGTRMSLSDCEFGQTNSDHAWVYEYSLFRNVLSSLCLDVDGYAANNGATVQIAACDLVEARTGKVTDQLWTRQAPEGQENGTYLINHAKPGRCLTVEGGDFSYGAWIVLQDCEFNGSNRTSQLWEIVEVCKTGNSNAYDQNCLPTCKRNEYIQDNLCVPCPSGQFSQENQCRSCPAHQFWNVLEEVCSFCPDGKQVAADMHTCEDQTFIGLTEIQWAAVGTASAFLLLMVGVGVFLAISRHRQCGWWKATSTAQDLPAEGTAGEAPARSSPDLVEVTGKPAASNSSPYQQDFRERMEEVQV